MQYYLLFDFFIVLEKKYAFPNIMAYRADLREGKLIIAGIYMIIVNESSLTKSRMKG